MIQGKLYDGLKVDIWSTGIILYALLCGVLPFDDTNIQNLYQKILSGNFNIPTHLSTESVNLLKGILQVNPAQRFGLNEIRSSDFYYKNYRKQEFKGIIVGID